MSEAAPQQRRWPSSIWHTSLQSPPTCITSTHWQTTLKSHKKDACNCFSYCSTCLIYSGLNTYEYTTISCFALAMGSNSLQIDHLFLAFPKFPENRFTASYYFLLVFFTALSMIGCWHDNVLCLSVRLWCCAVWLNDTSHTAKVSEQVNRKCPLGAQFYNFQPSTLTLSRQAPHLMHHKHWCHLANILKHTQGSVTYIHVFSLSPILRSAFAAKYVQTGFLSSSSPSPPLATLLQFQGTPLPHPTSRTRMFKSYVNFALSKYQSPL